ncbi:HEL321Wp [Eremothecium sinecaudum]|uniref:Mitochondrial import inner membrane translocase subunit n=1 Tax=Eremothecium sinecaudum TaxID=45286 RepID=A0A0X8HT50_9SACH|nr:HEL321Wp [Eremothecium sinecaudum]AMD20960.1 HEL321Wp [Eremothecium sinecaudum]
MSALSQDNLQNLDEASKKELMTFLESENSKQKIQMSIHKFTNICFNQCIDSISDAGLSSQESDCLKNCVNRFLDTNISIVKGLQNLQ